MGRWEDAGECRREGRERSKQRREKMESGRREDQKTPKLPQRRKREDSGQAQWPYVKSINHRNPLDF